MTIKPKVKILLVSFIIILTFLLVLPLSLTIYMYNQAFGVRVDDTDDYYNYLLKSHPDFSRTSIQFVSNKGQKLQGYFYFYDSTPYKGLIVMAHGMGGGHDSYLAEAEYLSASGYLVFAYDNTGTNESEGERLIGLSQSSIDLHYALEFIEGIPELNQVPLLLYGHSWGGFAVASVGEYAHPIKAIVSVSGFSETRNVLKQQGKVMVGNLIEVFMPYVDLYESILFGKKASCNGISGLSSTDAKVLLIHSEDDMVVDYQDNFMQYKSVFSDNPRFTFLSLTSHGHNAVLSIEANTVISVIQDKMELIKDKNSKEYISLESQELDLILELDTKIMNTIVEFFNKVCD